VNQTSRTIRTRGEVRRTSVTSSRSFDHVMASLDAAIGHPDMAAFRSVLGSAATDAELQKIVHDAAGPSGLMELARFDLGVVLREPFGGGFRRSLRLLVGNPLIMKQMVKHVPDGGSYAPVTILVDERADGVHLSYDTMAGYLAPYENEDALRVAEALDSRIEALLSAAAA
jgi:hypothetical protein